MAEGDSRISRPSCGVSRSSRWKRIIDDCKRKHRSQPLSKWKEANFHAYPDSSLLPDANMRGIPREDCNSMSVQDFVDKYERPGLPLIIEGIPEAEKWSAVENWNIKQLSRRYRNRRLKCGEDDDGYSVKIKLKYFLEYMELQQDDSPLYVFDSSYDDDPKAKSLMNDYQAPGYFNEDLFKLVGEKRRPPYRWFLIGPKRSGTNVHIDPLGTSAWNTLISGRKRWVVFPPEISKRVVKGKHHIRDGDDDEPINYFLQVLPRIKAECGESVRVYEFLQRPGDTVFIPEGWWHAVLNVDDTVAITQNFCSTSNFDQVWRKTRSGRKKMACRWLERLEEEYPPLARRAVELNKADGFVMKYASSAKSSTSTSNSSSGGGGGGGGGGGTGGGGSSNKRKHEATSASASQNGREKEEESGSKNHKHSRKHQKENPQSGSKH